MAKAKNTYAIWPIAAAGAIMWGLYKIYNTPRLTYTWLSDNTVQFNLTKGSAGINGTFSITDQPQEVEVQGYQFAVNAEGDGFIGFTIYKDNNPVFYQSIVKDTRSNS